MVVHYAGHQLIRHRRDHGRLRRVAGRKALTVNLSDSKYYQASNFRRRRH
jgi:hypothetical protein